MYSIASFLVNFFVVKHVYLQIQKYILEMSNQLLGQYHLFKINISFTVQQPSFIVISMKACNLYHNSSLLHVSHFEYSVPTFGISVSFISCGDSFDRYIEQRCKFDCLQLLNLLCSMQNLVFSEGIVCLSFVCMPFCHFLKGLTEEIGHLRKIWGQKSLKTSESTFFF